MRFMIIRKADAETEAGAEPTEELITAMLAYNQRMIDAGVFIDGTGLKQSARGARVSFSNGKPMVTDGPFAEAKELVAGFSILEVKSREEAIEWVKDWPPLDGHGNAQIEIRELFSASDFGAEAESQFKNLEARRK
jgi:hypothetical protein